MKVSKTSVRLFLFPALSVMVAIMLLGYSAYGWFVLSDTVMAVGKNVSVSAPSNLLISLTGDDNDWHNSVDVNLKQIAEEMNVGYTADEDFYILPASSPTGLGTMWTTDRAKYNGAIADSENYKPGHILAYDDEAGAYEGHYFDIPLWFLGNCEDDSSVGLSETVSKVTSVLDGDFYRVVRVAFLNADKSAFSNGTSNSASALVYRYSSEATDTLHDGVVANGPEQSDCVAPDFIDFTDRISDDDIMHIDNGVKKQIVIRIWIEGQDKNCVPKIGNQTFTVDLGFMIKD